MCNTMRPRARSLCFTVEQASRVSLLQITEMEFHESIITC